MNLKIKKLHPDAIIPTRAYPTDSGLDLYSIETLELKPGKVVAVDTGIAIELPPPFYVTDLNGVTCMCVPEAQIRPRSGLAKNRQVTVINSPGTVDNSWRGSTKVLLLNQGDYTFGINKGDRIAQMVIATVLIPKIEVVEELSVTDRGENGFGSTGVK